MICEFHMIFHGDDYWYIPGSIIKKTTETPVLSSWGIIPFYGRKSQVNGDLRWFNGTFMGHERDSDIDIMGIMGIWYRYTLWCHRGWKVHELNGGSDVNIIYQYTTFPEATVSNYNVGAQRIRSGGVYGSYTVTIVRLHYKPTNRTGGTTL